MTCKDARFAQLVNYYTRRRLGVYSILRKNNTFAGVGIRRNRYKNCSVRIYRRNISREIEEAAKQTTDDSSSLYSSCDSYQDVQTPGGELYKMKSNVTEIFRRKSKK